MSRDVIMPALGMAQKTGLIVRWLKQAGDPVKAGDVLMEVETDKAMMEVEADADGTLTELPTAPLQRPRRLRALQPLHRPLSRPQRNAPRPPLPFGRQQSRRRRRPRLPLRLARTDAYLLRHERAGLRRSKDSTSRSWPKLEGRNLIWFSIWPSSGRWLPNPLAGQLLRRRRRLRLRCG
jgi:hypothetical protein